MRIAMIGLGKMGANMTTRLLQGDHRVVAYDLNEAAIQAAEAAGAEGARLLSVDDYLDYISNRVIPDLGAEIRTALEGLWSSSAVPGSEKLVREFALSCAACGLPDGGLDLDGLGDFVFMIMLQDFMDPWTFNQKNLMKCCKEILNLHNNDSKMPWS